MTYLVLFWQRIIAYTDMTKRPDNNIVAGWLWTVLLRMNHAHCQVG